MSKGQARPSSDYHQALERLVKVGRAMADAESRWKPTPLRAELEAVAKLSHELSDRLAGTSVWQEIEESLEESTDCSLNALVLQLIELRNAARDAASSLPDSRARPAAPWVVSAWLHVRLHHNKPRPKTSVDGDDVGALVDLLQACGFAPSRDNASTMLKKALREFDPALLPPRMDEVLF